MTDTVISHLRHGRRLALRPIAFLAACASNVPLNTPAVPPLSAPASPAAPTVAVPAAPTP